MEGVWPGGWHMNVRQEKQALFGICVDPCHQSRAYTLGNSTGEGQARMRRLRKNVRARLENVDFSLELLGSR